MDNKQDDHFLVIQSVIDANRQYSDETMKNKTLKLTSSQE